MMSHPRRPRIPASVLVHCGDLVTSVAGGKIIFSAGKMIQFVENQIYKKYSCKS